MDDVPNLTVHDLAHLRRCVDLAREALAKGHDPFGSVLVDARSAALHEDRNRTGGGGQTADPELQPAHGAAAQKHAARGLHVGEQWPMRAAGHAGVGSAGWCTRSRLPSCREWGATGARKLWPVMPLPIEAAAPGLAVTGSTLELAEELGELHKRAAEQAVVS